MAGPRTLEHLVDVVLYLEGDKYPMFGRFGMFHPALGNHHTKESKERISVGASKNHIDVSGKNNPMFGVKGKRAPAARKIVNINTGEVFDTINDACKKYELFHSGISKSCTSTWKCGGFKWEYA